MGLKLYGDPMSFPYRAVLITAKSLKLDIEEIKLDLFTSEHRKPDFAKKNPQRTIPVLEDDGFCLADSHAIVTYLVGKYGKSDSLYPKDLQQRALVDRLLHYDSGIIFPCCRDIFYPILVLGCKTIEEEKKELVVEAYDVLEQIISESGWCVGNNITLADICLASAITSVKAFVPIPETKYPRLTKWIQNCYNVPYFREDFKEYIYSTLDAFLCLKVITICALLKL